MRILFVTRKFPPTVGGMENVAFQLSEKLKDLSELSLLKWGGSNKWLPLVMPVFFIRATFQVVFKKPDLIYLQDGVLAPLGVWLKMISSIPVCITIHGLDVTYKNKLYQYIIPRSINRLDRAMAVSDSTKQLAVDHGVARAILTVIPNGINDIFYIDEPETTIRQQLAQETGVETTGKKILLSAGRLVERKGVHWFIENVFSDLCKNRNDLIYLISGAGKYEDAVKDVIKKENLEGRAILLGRTSDKVLRLLYNSADIFIMPNISVKDDAEGFGIVLIEASSTGLPVVASKIEGIPNAVIEGETGCLVPEKDKDLFIENISYILNMKNIDSFRKKVRAFTLSTYHWTSVSEMYMSVFKELTKG